MSDDKVMRAEELAVIIDTNREQFRRIQSFPCPCSPGEIIADIHVNAATGRRFFRTGKHRGLGQDGRRITIPAEAWPIDDPNGRVYPSVLAVCRRCSSGVWWRVRRGEFVELGKLGPPTHGTVTE